MMNITTISNKVSPSNPHDSLENIKNDIEKSKNLKNVDIILLSSNPFSGSSIQNVILNPILTNSINGYIYELAEYTKSYSFRIIFQQNILQDGIMTENIFILFKGTVEKYIPSIDRPFRILINDEYVNILYNIFNHYKEEFSNNLSIQKNDILLIPSSYHITAGKLEKIKYFYKKLSEKYDAQIYFCNGNVGNSDFPYMYNGFIGYFKSGNLIHFEASLYDSLSHNYSYDTQNATPMITKKAVQNENNKTPYIFGDEKKYLLEVFELQVASLYYRLKNINIKNIVIGISGGLDSTLALLVSVEAMKLLGEPNSNITAITMPGFGTSNETFENAKKIAQILGCNFKSISIIPSLVQHFSDIGHDQNIKDTVYENAQARERTQILLDISNKIDAIVVGTGDLSESALGFCTFAGDHISNFNVNICITKTMIRIIFKYLIEDEIFEEITDILEKILKTPISPELIGSNKNEIQQKTEDILGPYILHDFFLYYFIVENYTPKQIVQKALEVFEKEFKINFIREKLKLFFKKFFASQFKRNCSPDATIITDFNLSTLTYSYPSDYKSDIFIQNI